MSRRRYVYRQNDATGEIEAVEVSRDWVSAPMGGGRKSDYEKYGKLQAQDGTPIDSKTKHRRYMKERGLAMAEDYRDSWDAAERRRAEAFSGARQDRAVRESIERAWHKKTGY